MKSLSPLESAVLREKEDITHYFTTTSSHTIWLKLKILDVAERGGNN